MDDDGGLDQWKVTDRILLDGIRETEPRVEYENVRTEDLPLSTLAHMWENDNADAAMALLFKKHRLTVDDRYLLPISDGNVVLAWMGAYQDYKLVIPSGIGLHAALPNLSIPEVRDDPNWNFNMHLNRRHWEFFGDRPPFGFDTAKRMVNIGETSSGDDIWMVWAPSDRLGARAQLGDALELSKEGTRMDPPTARVMMAMLGWMLQHINFSNISLVDDYPDVTSDATFRLSTDFMERRDLRFSLDAFTRLNDAIKTNYRAWVRGAPAAYRNDIVKGAVPCCIRIRYGQNRRIACDRDVGEDARYWEKDFDLPHIARIQLAIAKHYAAFEVDEWQDIMPEEIINQHRIMYTTDDEDTREEIEDLDELPLLDMQNQEIPIYNAEGKRIPRRRAVFTEDDAGLSLACGLLQDLSQVRQLFDTRTRQRRARSRLEGEPGEDHGRRTGTPEVHDGDGSRSDEKGVPLWFFPHFFSSKYGQWQADGVMNAVLPTVDKINQTLRAYEGVGMCVEPVRSQCYNTYAHETRASAKLHVAQRGMLTATVGGAWEGNQKGARTAKNLFEQTDWRMPHERLEAQTDKVTKTTATPSSSKLFSSRNAGKCNDVLKRLKCTTVVFKPQIWPQLYSITTYPVTAMIRAIWNAHLRATLRDRVQLRDLSPTGTPSAEAMRLTPMPFYLEWIAVLERCLNFAYTGAAKVICYKLMNQLWAGRALRDGLMPVLWSSVFMLNSSGIPRINILNWPIEKNSQRPLVASEKSLTLTYGKAHFIKYWTHLMIVRVASKPPVSTDPVKSERACLHAIALLAVDAYIEDVRALVREELGAIIDGQAHQEGSVEEANMKMRWRTFKHWSDLSEPLAWGERGETYTKLVRMVIDNENAMPDGLPVSTIDKCSLEDFVQRIFKMGTKTTLRSVQAPLVRKGASWPVLTMVIRECQKRLGEVSDASARTICSILVDAFKERKVEYVPDRLPPKPNPTIKAWTILSEAHGERTAHIDRSLQNPRERRAFQLSEHARSLSESAVNADWQAVKIPIGHYHKYLTRTTCPVDCRRDRHEQLASDVATVYNWAEHELQTNFSSWKCQLAVTLAFLVSKVLPNVHLPPTSQLAAIKAELKTVTPQHQESAIPIIRKIKFTSKDIGGSKDRKTYFTVTTLVILALIVPESPLRAKLERDGKLYPDWAAKHRAKAITTPTLIRLGVLNGHGPGLLHAAKWGQWNVRDEGHLRTWWEEITRSLQTPPHGPYHLIAKIFGATEAERQVGQGEFPGLDVIQSRAPMLGGCSTSPSSSKRSRQDSTSQSSEDEEEGDDEERRRREKRSR
ncbi:hypothetical protein GSI_09932 [Ganoderma sinense ZZ0214-1]|uniref:DUF8190 domain-containing protein n=1 Tax=Ganoderma sinense ZZ0214-1 TaxID=1077348 RepID=A0A2G8S362_9APHY|nr:hypothetical protein GSI_09932 [Ganoderma sinense ZZ0214-1]